MTLDPRTFGKNWVANPSFEYGTDGYTGGWNATLPVQSSSWAAQGTKSGQIQTNLMGVAGQNAIQVLGDDGISNFPVIPGQQVSAAAVFNITARVGNAAAYVQCNWVDASLAFLSAVNGSLHDTTGIVRSVIDGATAPGGAAFVQMYLVGTEGTPNPPAGQLTGFVDAVQLHFDAAICPEYADGDTPGWEWTSTPGNSSSAHPVINTVGGILLDELGVTQPGDELRGYPMALLMTGAGAVAGDLYDIVRDRDEGVGWSILLDTVRCPPKYLPWQAQFAGVKLPAGISEADARARITSPPAFRRGTISAVKDAVRATLTGTKDVELRYRVDGDAYAVQLFTDTAETPDPAATEAAALAQLPWWLDLTYEVTDSGPVIDEATRTIDALTGTIDDATLANWT